MSEKTIIALKLAIIAIWMLPLAWSFWMIAKSYRRHRRFMKLMKDADNAIAAMEKAMDASEIRAHSERFEEIMEHAERILKK